MSAPITSASIRQVLLKSVPALPDDDNVELLFSGYIDSFALVQIVTEMEAEFKVSFGPEQMKVENFSSIAAIEKNLNQLRASS